MKLTKRVGEAHDKLFPVKNFHFTYKSVESGGYPGELWGSVEGIQRQIRTSVEILVLTTILLCSSVAILQTVTPDHLKLPVLGISCVVGAPIFLWAIRSTLTGGEDRAARTALRKARRNPGNLKVTWGTNPTMQQIIWEHLLENLDTDELEVAAVLCEEEKARWSLKHSKFPGTVQELCDLSRELCRETRSAHSRIPEKIAPERAH